MAFAGINYLAVLIAGVAGFLVGWGWYAALGKPWMAALGKTKDDLKPTPLPYILAFAALLVMSYMLAGVIGHLGDLTVTRGIVTGFFCWLGFVVTTMAVNHGFQGASPMLTAIDGGHWLAVLVVMGAIIGAFGV